MKAFIKQKSFWLAMAFFVCAILLAVLGSVLHPSRKVLKRMENAINKSDYKQLAKCVAPEYQDELDGLAEEIAGMESIFGETESKLKLKLLPAVTEKLEDGTEQLQVFVLESVDGTCQYLSVEEVKLMTQDGKQYITD